jgi:hypothetical protein
MFRNYLHRNFLVFLCTGNTALSHLGRLSGGAKSEMIHQNHEDEKNASAFFDPLERHVILYDFPRAEIIMS